MVREFMCILGPDQGILTEYRSITAEKRDLVPAKISGSATLKVRAVLKWPKIIESAGSF